MGQSYDLKSDPKPTHELTRELQLLLLPLSKVNGKGGSNVGEALLVVVGWDLLWLCSSKENELSHQKLRGLS